MRVLKVKQKLRLRVAIAVVGAVAVAVAVSLAGVCELDGFCCLDMLRGRDVLC